MPTTISKAVVATNPGGVIALRVPMDALLAELADKKDEVLPGGLLLKKDILGSLTGEMVMYTGSGDTPWGRFSLGINNATPFKALLNMGCGMLPVMDIPGLQVTVGDGTCDAIVDVAKLPLPTPELGKVFEKPIAVKAEVKDGQVSITVGKVSGGKKTAMTSEGKEILMQDWNSTLWMQNISIGLALHEVMPQLSTWVPQEQMNGVKLGVWVASHLNSIGYAMAVRDDGVHGVFHVGTYAADSDDAYAAYQEAVSKSLDSHENTFGALATKYPNSLAAGASSAGGSVMIAGITGAFAAVAIPAFMKYAERSRQIQEAMPPAMQMPTNP
ncbi:MAG: hypothetical protein JKY56_26485 [Kofleriaceae bacterium]|nr:hypothetical protein [Kofleriaceae bacterium]